VAQGAKQVTFSPRKTYGVGLLAAVCAALTSGHAAAQPGAVSLDAPPLAALPTPKSAVAPAPATPASAPIPTKSSGRRTARIGDVSASDVSTANPGSARATHPRQKPPKRDELDPRLVTYAKDVAPAEVNLPGVLRLDGASLGLLDPARARRVSCTNEGTVTVHLSATEPNRILLPFPNPRVVGTDDLEITKRADNNNVYITFKPGVDHPTTVWLEPHSGSSVACGFQLIPKRIPAQSIHVVDDTGALTPVAARAQEPDDFLSRVQTDLEDALDGRSPPGWSTVSVPVPPIALDGVLIEGVRRLSSLREDIYVYTVLNPGATDVVLDETEFDGPTVEAVSILPTPLLHSRGTTRVAVLARKSAQVSDAAALNSTAGGK
jgi:conjugal transfer pilus assembly protein TraK